MFTAHTNDFDEMITKSCKRLITNRQCNSSEGLDVVTITRDFRKN